MCHFGSYRFAQPVILLYKGFLEGHSSPYIFQQHQNLAIKSIILYPYSCSLTWERRGAINHAWELASFCSVKTIKEENFGAEIILLCFYYYCIFLLLCVSHPSQTQSPVTKGTLVFIYTTIIPWDGFPGGSDGKTSVCNAGDPGSIPGLGRSLEKGMTTQYSCLENSTDRGAWWAIVHGGHKESDTIEWTKLSLPFHMFICIYVCILFFKFFSILVYCKVLNTVPCAIQ